MVMAVNVNVNERIENFGQNWTSRKKLEKMKLRRKWTKLQRKRSWEDLKKCDKNGLPENNWKMKLRRKWTKLRQKRSWQDLKKKVVCKTALQVRGQKKTVDSKFRIGCWHVMNKIFIWKTNFHVKLFFKCSKNYAS